jgi:biotin synthase
VHGSDEVQLCTLLSVKTGGCPEDCAYCPQSSHYETEVGPEKMLDVDAVLDAARRAREGGSTRFCMGAAWREVKDGPAFDRVLDMVRGVKSIGLEACCTLGMLSEEQAAKLKEAGLDAYNHNLDTSRAELQVDHLDARLRRAAADAAPGAPRGDHACAPAGSSGWASRSTDRCSMLARARRSSIRTRRACRSTRSCASQGTPLEALPPIDPVEFVRMIATTRVDVAQLDGAPLRRADASCRARCSCSACTRARTRSSTEIAC